MHEVIQADLRLGGGEVREATRKVAISRVKCVAPWRTVVELLE